jgi:regulator of protease activity HflC (stomatin/prohibitin superfamily)
MSTEINEFRLFPVSGWKVLVALIPATIAVIYGYKLTLGTIWMIAPTVGVVAISLAFGGFFTLQPNEARVLILFGKYRGTASQDGLFWANPFYSNSAPRGDFQPSVVEQVKGKKKVDARYKISLRSRTFLSPQIKVNDKNGNPIEIAMMVVWKVSDTAKAIFQIDDYRTYVSTQAESTLRHVASKFSYDHKDSDHLSGEITLRSNVDEVSEVLRTELSSVLSRAGIEVETTRLTHLAYAPEIAHAMLRRQQAEAVISARRKIVSGAVGMVEMALTDLEKSGSLHLDDEKRAAMISNMLLVLVGDRDVTPVINTGTLYS